MNSLIIIHEEALRISHPVFTLAPINTKAIFIWNENYLINANYSLKRLVFIYEIICQLPIDIIHRNPVETINEIKPTIIYMLATNNSLLLIEIDQLKRLFNIEIVQDESFLENQLAHKEKLVKRFFQYWKHAETSIFKINGQNNAQGS